MPEPPLAPRARALLALRVWGTYVLVRLVEWRRPLLQVTASLGRPPRRRPARHSPARLSRAVDACLWPVGHPPRCLFSSLVLYRLLRAQGDAPELVIGLQAEATHHLAHAWIELAGIDVGPLPGKGTNVPLGRYP